MKNFALYLSSILLLSFSLGATEFYEKNSPSMDVSPKIIIESGTQGPKGQGSQNIPGAFHDTCTTKPANSDSISGVINHNSQICFPGQGSQNRRGSIHIGYTDSEVAERLKPSWAEKGLWYPAALYERMDEHLRLEFKLPNATFIKPKSLVGLSSLVITKDFAGYVMSSITNDYRSKRQNFCEINFKQKAIELVEETLVFLDQAPHYFILDGSFLTISVDRLVFSNEPKIRAHFQRAFDKQFLSDDLPGEVAKVRFYATGDTPIESMTCSIYDIIDRETPVENVGNIIKSFLSETPENFVREIF